MLKFWKKLNLPNRITLSRICLIPLYFLLLVLPVFSSDKGMTLPAICGRIAAAAVFLFTAITDFFDGKIARSRNLVTELGKFLDPVADKLMIFAAFLGLVCMDRSDRLFVLLLSTVSFLTLAREFAVTGLRTLALTKDSEGGVIPAAMAGKIKTVGQIVFVLCALLEPVLIGEGLGFFWPVFRRVAAVRPLTYASMAFMAVMTVVSGVGYFRAYFSKSGGKK